MPHRRAVPATALLFAALALTACSAMGPAPSIGSAPPEVTRQLAPSGKLRAAINFGNPVLASRDGPNGPPRGVSVDLARELAMRLGVEAELVLYEAAGKVTAAAKNGEWDIGFVAIDPARAADMDYSAPYVVIEGAYLVPNGSPIRGNDEVDRDGIRVVVGVGSAYDLYLSRELKHAKLVKVQGSQTVVDQLLAQKLDVAAGVKQQLQADAKRVPGVHLLDGRFMVINQAMAVAKGRGDAARYVAAFIEEMKRTGFVADALKRHGIEGAAVAPPAS